jgi:curved DNA-binding protein CbpA
MSLQKCYGSFYSYDYSDDNYQYIEQERIRYDREEYKINEHSSASIYNNASLKSKINDAMDAVSPIEQNYYSTLNVPTDATAVDIQRNFKILSRIYHPDKISSSLSLLSSSTITPNEAQETFVQIKTAADVLLDPIYRLTYDIGGPNAVILVKQSQINAKMRRKKQRRRQTKQNRDNSNNEHPTDYGNESKYADDDDTSREQDEDNDDHESDDESSDDEHIDLYTAIQQAQSMEDVSLIIEDALLEYLQQKQLQQERLDEYNRPSISLRAVNCSLPLETNMDEPIPIIRHQIRPHLPKF